MNCYLVDFSILLHDFFYRYPEYSSMRFPDAIQEEKMLNYRASIHEGLAFLANDGEIQVATCEHFLLRLASIMAEYHVPNTIMVQELSYLLNNYKVLKAEAHLLIDTVQNLVADSHRDTQADIDFLYVEKIMHQAGIDIFLTTDPRFLSFTTPELQVCTIQSLITKTT